MLGGIHTDLLVTVTLLFLSQTGTHCRAENDFSLVTLPDWRIDSEYVTQCLYDGRHSLACDWTRSRQISSSAGDVAVNVFESVPLTLEGEACLEFWYLAPVAAKGSELRVLLKSSSSLEEVWTSPALPRDSWRQVFVPLNVTERGTQVVFEAAQAASIDGEVAFKQMGVRRGSCGHQCESNMELWTDESTRCLCSAGQFSCSPSLCPTGQICGPQRGASIGTSAPGTCTIHSNTDCSTFDGVLFRFMGPCTYTLARTCLPSEAQPTFSVEVVNKQNENSSLPTVQSVIVETGNFRVSLLKKETHRVVVNGVWRKLPLTLSSGTVNIKSNPASVSLGTSFGLSVSYDNAGSIHVSLPPTYSDHVCGLCGNFNHLRGDDFRKPDGTNAEDATALAESWQTEQTNSSCETVLIPHECEPLEEAEYASEQYCGSLFSTTGPFADCLSILGAESYFRGCMVSMCSSHGDPAALCNTLQLYADVCLEAGVAIPIWRNSSFCPLQCGENSHYNPCANDCPEVCSSLDIVGSCGSCEERCECDSGFKLTGGKCVPAEECGCWHNGTHYERGETLLEGECEQHCQCMGNNVIQCITMRCPDNEVCKIMDGVKGCFPFNPATCSVYGDPHYITFDGLAYDFQGGCSYTLATTCGAETAVRFTVIGHNMHPPLQNFTRSKLEAVTLKVDTFYMTLNQSGEVNVNNTHVQPPYSFADANMSFWVYKKNNYTVLETTFGIRMMIDGQNRFFLQVDERYKYELCGLCGTYSDHQDDDFITPGGQNVAGPFEFGDSWRVGDDNECIAHPNEPSLCNNDEENEAYIKCYALLGEAFQACHKVIHPSIYLSSCVSDYCATSGDLHTLCESLKSYAAACEVAGVKLPPWQTGTACSDPPTTTASPVTTPASASSTPDQSICPINCNFEKNLCGWEQLIQDSFDWTRNSGPTPSQQTGPKQDHTTGAGSYMYIEGDSVTHGDSARLLSSMCHYHGPVCLHFWYNMYGSATAMALNMYLLKDNKATKLWSIRNNQGTEWHPAHIDINVSGPFQIIMEGIRGSTAQSDVAIDDISIHFGSCSGSSSGLVGAPTLPSTTVEVFPSHPVCSVDCTFDSNLCNWNQMITDAFDWTWGSGSTPTMMTGPSTDHTGDGHYLYIEASSVTHGDTARLISAECSDSGPQCLQFWYHMYGSADTMGLHVYLLQNKLADAIWWKRNDQGNLWKVAQVDFTTTGAFQIIIEGRRGSSEESDVAIDDIKLYRGRCSDLSGVVTSPRIPTASTEVPPSVPVPTTGVPEFHSTPTVQLPVTTKTPAVEATTSLIGPPHPACQLQCDFERDTCQWSQLLADVFDWTRHRGSTPTMMTGPSSDHTLGDGYYLYIEANSATHGDTARLISSECSDSGPQCLQFWYHMYGSADTMGLHVYVYQDAKAERIWWKRNNQENMWHLAQVDLNTTGAFQIIFEGRRGSNDQSDVAVDDISFHRGPCADLTNPTTPATTSETGLQTTVHPESSTTARPQLPTTAEPLPPTTDGPQPQTTAQPQPPTTGRPQPPTTDRPQPPTTNGPEPQTTAQPQPPTTDEPQPPTTDGPQAETTVQPHPQTTAQTQPPTTVGPQLQTTVQPQPPTTDGLQPQTSAQPQPPTDGPQAETTVQPQPHTTALPLQPTDGPQLQTTVKPQPPATDGPQPQTTVQPQPPTDGPQSQTTVQTQPPTTGESQPPTTDGPQPQTSAQPQPPTDGPQAETTVQPQPQTTAQPQPPTDGPQLQTTVKPQPPTDGPQLQTTVQPQPTTTHETQPPATDGPQPQTTIQPQPPTTDGPQAETTIQPQPQTTAQSQPPTDEPQPQTTALPQPPTDGPQLQTTVKPQPPTDVPQLQTTVQPQPPTTDGPQAETTIQPQPQTTAQPQPPTTDGPQAETTAQPIPPTDVPQLQTTIQPQPPTTGEPQPPTTDGPQPQTTAQPQPPTDVPQLQTTVQPQPPTTHEPQPPATDGPQPQTTAQPQPPTTDGPQAETTAQPLPPTDVPQLQTTVKPQPPTDVPQLQTTIQPQPPTTGEPQPPTTDGPQPQTTAQPQPPTTDGPQPQTTVKPQPPTDVPQLQTTVQPQPPTTHEPQPPATDGPQPQTTAQPQPPTTDGPQAETTIQPQPQTTAQSQPPTDGPQLQTTVKPQPPTDVPQLQTTVQPQPPTTGEPQPPTTDGPQPQTTAQPQPPTTDGPQAETTVQPQPQTTAQSQPPTDEPQPQTTAHPQPPPTDGPQAETTTQPLPPTDGPQLQTTIQPQPPTTGELQPPTTDGPQPQTTAQPQPPTTDGPQPQTTVEPQPPTTDEPQPQTTIQLQPPTTDEPQPPTTDGPQPQTTAQPQVSTTNGPQPQTTVEPQPPTTDEPQPQTTIQPQPPTTDEPQPPTTDGPQPQTTAQPQVSTTNGPQPQTTAHPQPPTTDGPQVETTVQPQPQTTAHPQPPTSGGPQPETTAKPQPPTTVEPTSAVTEATTASSTTARPATPTPTPLCPTNSHYTTCIPSCSPTCAYINGPPHCSHITTCVPGCVCNEGFVQKGQVCVPLQECGCMDRNGAKYQFNEVWYTEHCRQKCECEKRRGVGRIDCDDKDECDRNGICLQNEEGDYYCQATGYNECTVKRDSEYRTFDEMRYDFDGDHSYVLVRTKNLPNNLPAIYIEGINTKNTHDDDDDDDDDDDSHHHHGDRSSEEDDSHRDSDEDDKDDDEDGDHKHSHGHGGHHRLQELKIRVYNHTVELKKRRNLVVDGKDTDTPASPAAGLNIYQHHSRIYLKTDFGLTVEFDGDDTAEIVLPRIYKRRVGGLCGNFDDDRRNEWTKPDGSRARNVREFVESWRV